MKHVKTSRIFSLLALVLAVTMLLTLVGCGGSDKPDETKKTTTTTTTTTTVGNTDGTTTNGEDTTTTEGDATTTGGDIVDPFGTTAPTKPTASNTTGGSGTSGKFDYQKNTKELLKQVPAELSGTKITMLIWWTAGGDDENEAKIFKEQTGIQVRYETAAMDKYQTNLAAKVTSGNPPALAAIINEWYPQPITRRLMQPIKNTGWDYSDKKLYAHNMMDQFSYKGEHYGIALKGSNMSTFEVMFFNKKTMANDVKAGADPYSLWKKGQWNWNTALSLAQKYTEIIDPDDIGKNKYGMTLIYQNYWMLSAGQDFVISDINGLKNNITNSKVLDAWTFAWKMIHEYKVIPKAFSNQQSMFFSGQIAMLGGGSYFMQSESTHNYVPQNTKDPWSVVPFPSPEGLASVAACEGTVWGFPTNVKGKQLQAGMWFLRYFLDDYNCSSRDFYPQDECWEIMSWMWNQKIQSFNSVGVLAYGGKHSAASIQYSVIDEAATLAAVKTNLESWKSELDTNIEKILTEL